MSDHWSLKTGLINRSWNEACKLLFGILTLNECENVSFPRNKKLFGNPQKNFSSRAKNEILFLLKQYNFSIKECNVGIWRKTRKVRKPLVANRCVF